MAFLNSKLFISINSDTRRDETGGYFLGAIRRSELLVTAQIKEELSGDFMIPLERVYSFASAQTTNKRHNERVLEIRHCYQEEHIAGCC